jgi:hypothetical protein
MFVDRKSQYCHDVSSSPFGLQIQQNPNQNSPASYFVAIDKVILKVYTEGQKTVNYGYCLS